MLILFTQAEVLLTHQFAKVIPTAALIYCNLFKRIYQAMQYALLCLIHNGSIIVTVSSSISEFQFWCKRSLPPIFSSSSPWPLGPEVQSSRSTLQSFSVWSWASQWKRRRGFQPPLCSSAPPAAAWWCPGRRRDMFLVSCFIIASIKMLPQSWTVWFTTEEIWRVEALGKCDEHCLRSF